MVDGLDNSVTESSGSLLEWGNNRTVGGGSGWDGYDRGGKED